MSFIGLDIAKAIKLKLKKTLKKFPTLFGGGLGTLKMNPVNIKLKADAKLHAGIFYNIPKAYKSIAKTKMNCLCTVDVLEKLNHTEDSRWVTPSFC